MSEGGLVILLILAIFIYFVPTIIAKNRKHKNADSIGVINLFLGWTLLGWVIALAWAVSNTGQTQK